MRILSEQRKGPLTPAKQPVATAVARGRRRTGSPAITAAVVGGALLILAVVYSLRGPVLQATTHRPSVASAGVSNVDTVRPTRLQRASAWVDGLAAGQILLSDVTSRLEAQDPRMAKVVAVTWSDLNSLGNEGRLQEALGWLDGLVARLIPPSDVTSRLEANDPRVARVVLAAWSDLNSETTWH
jgi:hypothetical protein